MIGAVIYTQHPVTPPLLARLWLNLWDRGREELARNGWSMQQGFDLMLLYAKTGDGGILCADGEPVLVAGICPDTDGVFTFMQASNTFDRHYRQIIRVMRRYVRKRDGEVFIYSVTVHPKSAAFFRALGFVRDDWQEKTRAGYDLFRFKRKPKCAAVAAPPTP